MHITTKFVSSNPALGEVYAIQHYVIQFFTDLHSTALESSTLTITLPISLYISKSKVQDEDSVLFTSKLFIQLYVRFGIILSCGTHLHDRIIWLRWSVLAPNQVYSFYWSIYTNECSKRSCMLLLLWFSDWILKLFWRCDTFCF